MTKNIDFSCRVCLSKKIEEFKRNITKLDNWRKMYIKDYLGPVAEAYGL